MAVNVKIFLATHSYDGWSIFWVVGSIVLFYICISVLSAVPDSDMTGVSTMLVNLAPQWTLMTFYIIGFSLTEYLIKTMYLHMKHFQEYLL